MLQPVSSQLLSLEDHQQTMSKLVHGSLFLYHLLLMHIINHFHTSDQNSSPGYIFMYPSPHFVCSPALMPMLQQLYVTLSHLRSKEPPGLHFVCSPASQANCEIHLGNAYIRIRLWGSINTHVISMNNFKLTMKIA